LCCTTWAITRPSRWCSVRVSAGDKPASKDVRYAIRWAFGRSRDRGA
jgi:hypothetical protein